MAAFFLAPLYILINVYLVLRGLQWMGMCHALLQHPVLQALFVLIYTFFASSLLTCFLIKSPAWLNRILKHASNYFLGSFLYLLMICIVVELLHLILKYGFHAAWIHYPQAQAAIGGVCLLLLLAVSIHGVLNAHRLHQTNYSVSIDKKAGDLSSLRVVLVADTHFGYSIGPSTAEHLAQRINEQHPDLVCFAGDLFDNDYDAISHPERVMEALKSIRSTYGSYACWGNHDLNEPILAGFTFGKSHPDYEDPRMAQLLSDAGITLLNDETVLLGGSFYLTGRRDPDRADKMDGGRKTPTELFSGLNPSHPLLVMDHQPKELQALADAGVDLDLCGHTHDGQLFPGNLWTSVQWENSCGYLKKDSMHNIVTSGVGIWGPNMRVGTRAEFCVIDISFAK